VIETTGEEVADPQPRAVQPTVRNSPTSERLLVPFADTLPRVSLEGYLLQKSA